MTLQTIPLAPRPLRERHKRARRDRILEAARELLRAGAGDTLSTEQIAARAEVSPATVYNLIGPREQLWSALVDDLLERLESRLAAAPAPSPLERLRQVVRTTVELFVDDPVVHRHVLSHFSKSGSVLRQQPVRRLVAALSEAQASGLLLPELDARALGRHLATSCIGAMHQWAAGMIDTPAFFAHALLGVDVVMAAAAAPRHRRALLVPVTDRRAPRRSR